MLEKPLVSEFSHVKPGDTVWRSDGLRDFFLYRDLGIADATGGRVIAQLVKANEAPEKGTGWHRHQADFHIVLMLKGWAKFMCEDEEHGGKPPPLAICQGGVTLVETLDPSRHLPARDRTKIHDIPAGDGAMSGHLTCASDG